MSSHKHIIFQNQATMKAAQQTVYDDLLNPKKFAKHFKDWHLRLDPLEEPDPAKCQFVATVTSMKEPSFIHGTVTPSHNNADFTQYQFDWELEKISRKVTRVTYTVYDASEGAS